MYITPNKRAHQGTRNSGSRINTRSKRAHETEKNNKNKQARLIPVQSKSYPAQPPKTLPHFLPSRPSKSTIQWIRMNTYLQRGVLEQRLVVRRDTECLDRHVQRVGPLLVPCGDRCLRAAELRALAVSRLLSLLVLGGSPARLHFFARFFFFASVLRERGKIAMPTWSGVGWDGLKQWKTNVRHASLVLGATRLKWLRCRDTLCVSCRRPSGPTSSSSSSQQGMLGVSVTS